MKTYRIALTEHILGALDDEILTLIAEENIEDEISETGIFRESIHQMIVQIDEALNAVEVENSGHTDKSISHYPSKGRFTRYDFAAYDKLTTRLRHELPPVNQTYNSLNGPKSCRRPVVSLSYATKSYRVNRP